MKSRMGWLLIALGVFAAFAPAPADQAPSDIPGDQPQLGTWLLITVQGHVGKLTLIDPLGRRDGDSAGVRLRNIPDCNRHDVTRLANDGELDPPVIGFFIFEPVAGKYLLSGVVVPLPESFTNVEKDETILVGADAHRLGTLMSESSWTGKAPRAAQWKITVARRREDRCRVDVSAPRAIDPAKLD